MLDNSSININHIKSIICDLDGVIYEGNTPLEGAVESIDRIRKPGLRLFFFTNNSGHSRAEHIQKLESMGIKVRLDEIISSPYLTSIYLSRDTELHRKKALVIGTDGLRGEVRQTGIQITSQPPYDYLIVGYEPRFNYEMINLALQAILQHAIFIACNLDPTFPFGNDQLRPGCGAMVGAIEGCTGKKPDFVVGKPELFGLKIISEDFGFLPQEMVVIGDMLGSDILMANRFGSPSVWINRHPQERLAICDQSIKPDDISPSLANFVDLLFNSA